MRTSTRQRPRGNFRTFAAHQCQRHGFFSRRSKDIWPAAGLLSFPRAGATLALDCPNRGERSARLFNELDAVVREAGGALYPAKDARMSGSMFRLSFPEWERFCAYIDPCFSSGFWRRVSE
jgi:hypothetical protein